MQIGELMKSILIAFSVLGVLSLALSGCGSSGQPVESSGIEMKQQQVMRNVQSDPKMPPDVKASVAQQIQSEAAARQRPGGAASTER
jgi:predicted component of type VI protein secretion system